jgi:hypothetical protein
MDDIRDVRGWGGAKENSVCVTQSAVLHELQTLAESTKRLFVRLKKLHPEVSWQPLLGCETSWFMTTLA